MVVLIILVSLALHHYQTSREQLGREAYLAKQAETFDKHYAKPVPFIIHIITSMLLMIPLIGLYEGMAWVVSKTSKGMDENGDS